MDADLRGLSDEVFLETVYRRYLGRSVDAEGRAHYGGMLRKWRGRKRVLADIQRSAEARRFADLRRADRAPGGFWARVYPPLLPDELTSTPRLKPRVALLGTCLAEGLLQTAREQGWSMQHHLMDSGLQTAAIPLAAEAFDAVLVNLTLRTILSMAVADGDGDLFYLRPDADGEAVVETALARLQAVVEQTLAAVPPGLPVFFLPFLEPPAQVHGVFGRNRGRSLFTLVRSLNDALEGVLAGHPSGYFLEMNDICQYYGDAGAYDGYVSHYTHNGLNASSQQGEWICRDILDRLEGAWAVLCGKDPVKIIITDLDNTLWRGVLAEEEEVVPWRHTEGWPIGYAEALLECKRRGLLLAISSKNDEAPTCDRFRQVWGQALRLEDFCARQINWRPKSDNIADILQATNILPEQALFIDDNPLEIEEVRRAFPQMRFLTGAPERWRHVLLYAPETQVLRVTEESAHRTELIQAKMARDQAAPVQDRKAWLQDLGLTLRFDRIADARHSRYARALELLNKTNQFNTTGQRWSDAEMRVWLGAGGRLLAASAEDRFANHGLIALALLRDNEIVQVVLSCRVFGLGIETALLAEALRQMQEAGYTDYVGRFTATGRNDACRAFWPAHGFTMDAGDTLWRGSLPPHCPEWIRAAGDMAECTKTR